MRLIDADAAKSKAIIFTNAVIFGDESEEMITFARAVLDLLLMALDDAPTIEAEPVRHGRWVAQNEGRTRFMCSLCESKNYGGYEKYCPNCGARMEVKEND